MQLVNHTIGHEKGIAMNTDKARKAVGEAVRKIVKKQVGRSWNFSIYPALNPDTLGEFDAENRVVMKIWQVNTRHPIGRITLFYTGRIVKRHLEITNAAYHKNEEIRLMLR